MTHRCRCGWAKELHNYLGQVWAVKSYWVNQRIVGEKIIVCERYRPTRTKAGK